jgi:hypothetical protein
MGYNTFWVAEMLSVFFASVFDNEGLNGKIMWVLFYHAFMKKNYIFYLIH